MAEVAIYTRFTFGIGDKLLIRSVRHRKPYFAANAAARSPSRAATAYGATRSRYRSSAAIFTNVFGHALRDTARAENRHIDLCHEISLF